MPNQTRMLSRTILDDDKAAIEACRDITTYAPTNAAFNQAALDAAATALDDAEEEYVQRKADFDAARDAMVAAQWNRHNLVIGMRNQIKAQFGESSDELQAVGLKKKTEYRRRGRRPAPPTP